MIPPTSIIVYIIKHGPVSHSALEERAVKKHNLPLHEFDATMEKVAKDQAISSSVKGGDVWYKQRTVRPRPLSMPERIAIWEKNNPYPLEEVGESPFKVCFCAMWRADDGEVYNEKIHGHRDECDAVRWPEEFKSQYRREVKYG